MQIVWLKYIRGIKFCAVILSAALVGAYFALLLQSEISEEVVEEDRLAPSQEKPAEEEVEELEIQVHDLNIHIEELNRQVTEGSSQRARLSFENVELMKGLQEYKVQLDNSNQLKGQLATQLEETRRRLEDEERKLEIQVHDLNINIEELNQQVTEGSSQRARLSSENVELMKEVQEYKVQLDDSSQLMRQLVIQLEETKMRLEDEERFESDLQYFPDFMPRLTRDMLADDFESCLFKKSSAGKMGPKLTALTEFADLMASLKIKAALIEPSIIFCMLSQSSQKTLLKRKFQPEKYLKSKNIVTFGIREKYVYLLKKGTTRRRISAANFNLELARQPSSPWMQSSGNVINHAFFLRGSVVVHVVVFHKRGSYLWHGGIGDEEGSNIPPKESLHFADSDSAYDSFIAVDPGFSRSSLLLPTDPAHLLLQMSSSRFIECNEEVQSNFRAIQEDPAVPPDLQLWLYQLEARTAAAIGALKHRLTPLMMKFFICGGTQLGWYRQCGLIPYTTDVDFAAMVEDVDDLKTLMQLFEDDGHLMIKERMGVVEEGLQFSLNYDGLKVDLFFMYPESNGTWMAGHRTGLKFYFKYHYPNIKLCSADLLGRRVLVQCETEKWLEMDYGPDWLKPIEDWYYDTSVFNRGPNIYWNESMHDKVFEEF